MSSYSLPVDPKFIRRITTSPNMYTEQGSSAFMESWGGPARYQQLSRVDDIAREVYFAIEQGITTKTDLQEYTGYSPTQIDRAIKNLRNENLIVDLQEET